MDRYLLENIPAYLVCEHLLDTNLSISQKYDWFFCVWFPFAEEVQSPPARTTFCKTKGNYLSFPTWFTQIYEEKKSSSRFCSETSNKLHSNTHSGLNYSLLSKSHLSSQTFMSCTCKKWQAFQISCCKWQSSFNEVQKSQQHTVVWEYINC